MPYSDGNITFTVLSANRPQATDPYNSSSLQEFMMARAVQLTMNDHYYVDPSDTRHKYYGIYEITVTARYAVFQQGTVVTFLGVVDRFKNTYCRISCLNWTMNAKSLTGNHYYNIIYNII